MAFEIFPVWLFEEYIFTIMSDVDEMSKIIILQVLSAFKPSAKRFVNIKSI